MRGVNIPARIGLAAADTNPPAAAVSRANHPQGIGNGPRIASGVPVNVEHRVVFHQSRPHLNIRNAVEVAQNMQANSEPVRIQGSKGRNLTPNLILKGRASLKTMGERHAVPVAFPPTLAVRRTRCAFLKREGEERESPPIALHDNRKALAELAIGRRGLEHLHGIGNFAPHLRVDRARLDNRRMIKRQPHVVDYRLGCDGCNKKG